MSLCRGNAQRTSLIIQSESGGSQLLLTNKHENSYHVLSLLCKETLMKITQTSISLDKKVAGNSLSNLYCNGYTLLVRVEFMIFVDYKHRNFRGA